MMTAAEIAAALGGATRNGVRQVVVPAWGMIDAVATAPRRAALEPD